MIQNYYWFTVSLAMSLMDIVILYAVVHSFGGQKLDLSKKKLIQNVLIAIGYGIVLGSIFYLDEGNTIYRFTGYVFLAALSMWWTKRKIVDGIIFLVFLFLLIFFAQRIIFLPLSLLFDLREETFFLIGHTLTTFMLILLCVEVKFNNIFVLIQQKIHLKISIFLLFTISQALLFIFDFNTASPTELIFVVIILSSIFFYGVLATFITFQKKLDFSTDKYHDVINMFNGLHLSIETEDSLDKLKAQSRQIKEHLTGKIETDQLEPGNHEKNLEILLDETLKRKNKNHELILDLDYFAAHEKVLFGQLILMLGILFDNALEHGGEHPIFVSLNVSQKIFELTVKNSCDPLSEKQMKKMFKRGYTTKESIGNGKGLYNLEQEVKRYQDGEFKACIRTFCDYEEQYESDYLTISVDISHKSFGTNA